MNAKYSGRLELTWTNKDKRLFAHDDISYEWVSPTDYRVSEVRLLRDAGTVGMSQPDDRRSRDNLLIQGDALHALTSLVSLPEFADECAGKVKLVYIDPPFNTGQTFSQYDDNLEHSVWLTMMRDRLLQIRDLLSPDGTVWLHLDDTEVHRARCVMDEVFGTRSFVGCIVWRSSDNSNNDAKQFSTDHNSILVYGRESGWTSNRLPATEDQISHFSNPDNDPRGPWFDGNPVNSPNPRPNLRYTITSSTGYEIKPPPNGWRWSRETLEAKLATGEIRFSADGTSIKRRTYVADHAGLPASSLWVDLEETGHNRQAKGELRKLFPGIPTAELFKTPKPERLMRKILEVATSPGDLVLDCFAGSGTTVAVAHKMGRRWVATEWSDDTLRDFLIPRLTKLVNGEDPGGITDAVGWEGGGGFRILDVAPSMFEADEGMVFLAEWATESALGEATAAQARCAPSPECPARGRNDPARAVDMGTSRRRDISRRWSLAVRVRACQPILWPKGSAAPCRPRWDSHFRDPRSPGELVGRWREGGSVRDGDRSRRP